MTVHKTDDDYMSSTVICTLSILDTQKADENPGVLLVKYTVLSQPSHAEFTIVFEYDPCTA